MLCPQLGWDRSRVRTPGRPDNRALSSITGATQQPSEAPGSSTRLPLSCCSGCPGSHVGVKTCHHHAEEGHGHLISSD